MKGNKKRLIITAIAVLAAFFILASASASGGQIQLDDRMLIQGIGIDQTEDGVLVSVHISQHSQTEPVLEQVKGKTVLAAMDTLVQRSGKVPLYSHNLIVVLGKKCGEEGLKRYMDFFVRYYEARPSVGMFLAQGTAEEIFTLKEGEEYVKPEEIARMGQGGKTNGWTVYTRVIDFVNQMQGEGSSPYMPVVGVKDGVVAVTGTAIFQEDTYRTTLNPEESRILLLITKRLTGGQLVTELPKVGKVTATIRQGSAQVRPSIEKNEPRLDIAITCQTEISSTENMDLAADETLFPQLEQALESQLQATTLETLKKTLREQQADPFGFGRQIMQEQTAWWKQNRENWTEWLAKLPVTVQVEVTVESAG